MNEKKKNMEESNEAMQYNDTPHYQYRLKIPKARIAPLIGKAGQTKQELSNLSRCKIEVDSHEGEIKIWGKDPIALFELKEVITAIGRGFNPAIAKQLFKKDYVLEIVNIKEFAHTKNSMIRLRGRLIGEKGKARRMIEQLTDTNVCIYGKTVSIIGHVFDVKDAKRAIITLLQGSRHATVYAWLEKRRKERNIEQEINSEEFKFINDEEKEFVRNV